MCPTGPNFMSDGFRPETYPLWTAERPAVHQRSRNALHHRGSLVQRVRRRAALRLEVRRPPQLTAFFTSAPTAFRRRKRAWPRLLAQASDPFAVEIPYGPETGSA